MVDPVPPPPAPDLNCNSSGIKMSLVCISSVNNGGDFIAVMVK